MSDTVTTEGNDTEEGTETLPALREDEIRSLEQQIAVAPDVPVTPEMGELTRMAQLAVTFAGAKLVPRDLQGSPSDVLLIMMTARSLGLDYPTGFRELFIIDGKVSMSTKMKLALVRQKGYRVWPDPENDENSATWYGIRDGITYRSTFTTEDAQRVEAKEGGKAITLDRKSNHRQYPKRMLSWRSLGYLLDDGFSDVATGIYSPDELGAITDADGQPIDVSEVQPLVQSEKDQAKAERAAAGAELAPEEQRVGLRDRARALPEEIQADLKAKLAEADLPALMNLPAKSVRRVNAMLNGFEAKARAQGWEPPEPAAEEPAAPAEATQEGQEPVSTPADTPETASGDETEPEPPENEPEPAAEDVSDEFGPDGEAWPEYPEDLGPQCTAVAGQLHGIMAGVTDTEVAPIAAAVKGMQWRSVNSELAHVYHVPHEVIERLHIDARRMLLVGYRVAARPM